MKLEISVSTAAAMAQVTANTIRAWIRGEELPVARVGGKGPGRGTRIDAIEFVRWLTARVATPPGSLDLDQERARLAKWQADSKHQDVEVRAGELLQRDDVLAWVAAMINTAKQRLVQIPATIAAQVPHEISAAVAEAARRSIYEALADLAAHGAGPPWKRNGHK